MPHEVPGIRSHPAHLLIAFGMLSLFASCSDSGTGEASLPTAGATPESTVADDRPMVEPEATDDVEESLWGDPVGSVKMAGLQAAILADGVVTQAEMLRAMQATVECIERHGFRASISEYPAGGWSLTTSYQPRDAGRVETVTERCEEQYSTAAQLRYSVGHLSPETDIDTVWNCLLDRGILDGSELDPTVAFQLAEAVSPAVTWECIESGREDG